MPHGEEHQGDGEDSVDAEQRRVGVQRRGVDPLRIVQDDRRVDEEAEDPRADHVPERHGDEEVQRPLVGVVRSAELDRAHVLRALEAQERERHDLQRGEHRAKGDDRRRRPGPVQVMERADDAGSQVQEDAHVDDLQAELRADRADAGQDEREHDGGEDLEESLHPEVDDPPAPVLGVGEVAALAVQEAGHVEQRDGDRAVQEHVREPAAVLFRQKRRADGAHDQHQPDDHPGDEEDLPDAAQLDVLVALVSEEEAVRAEASLDGQPCSGKRTQDDDHHRHEQKDRQRPLPLRLLAHEWVR